jgi:rubrerythrin
MGTEAFMTLDNKTKIASLISNQLKQLLLSLAEKSEVYCVTKATQQAISEALSLKEDDIITCLNKLATLTTKLAIPRNKEIIKETEYKFQGTEALYDLLDAIRHEFRMLEFDLLDAGIVLEASQAINNLLRPSWQHLSV